MIGEWDCFNYNREQSRYSEIATDEHLVQNVCQWDIADDEEKEEEDFIVHTLPFKVLDVVYKSERQNHLKAACIKMKDDPKFVFKATIEPDPDSASRTSRFSSTIPSGTLRKEFPC